jgi:hypothetical protein
MMPERPPLVNDARRAALGECAGTASEERIGARSRRDDPPPITATRENGPGSRAGRATRRAAA